MSETVETLNFIMGTGGVVMLVAGLLLLVDRIFLKSPEVRNMVERWGLLLAAALTVGATIMALVYSEIFGFVPCGLCWLMRIFVFSQAFIMTTAFLKKDYGIAVYGMVLSVPGILIGLYQHYLQMGGGEFVPCPAAAGDCAKRILFEYDFMTFPLMGASMLFLLTMVYTYLIRIKQL
ncbi:disulfide bond formation protein B [Candidatus Kaiserbacteria bacterium]|nr:disulfide bond formation protein B [Candidatus Kaiserbacteria bacterium]